jgi:sodium-dependent dicarboxylate transporter 2/3/5
MNSKKIGILLGPLLFILILIVPAPAGLEPAAWKTIAMATWMLIWFITEALPLPVTALLPMVILPLLGLAKVKEAMAPYADPIIFLFMGGFTIALAMERWSLHRRIALNILKMTGSNANGIILGFFLATALISMWISNTATTIMMMPMALSVIDLVSQKDEQGRPLPGMRNFAISMMLGVSYASSIGGVGTLIGTPPNVVFAAQMKELFQVQIPFGQWMAVGTPYALLLLLGGYWIIVRWVYPNGLGKIEGARERIGEELEKMGSMSPGEKRTLLVFCLAAGGWIFKTPLEKAFPGLQIEESVVGICAALLLFAVPISWKNYSFALEWKDTEKLPWGILLLFGGGLSMASALSGTGIIDLIGQQFAGGNGGSWLFILGLVTVTVFLTELLSNIALVVVFIPVIGAVAQAMNIDPVVMCIPVTLAASSGFMLPMSTPPNAIVFSSGYLTVPQMVRAGIWLNLLSIVLMTVFGKLVVPLFF